MSRAANGSTTVTTLRVLSLNVWGLYYLARKVPERLKHISKDIRSYDIVALQEVWYKEDFATIRGAVADVLPHSHYFYSGVIGSGLCVFSSFPILSTMFHRFSVTGGLFEISDGEVFTGKGVGLCRLETPTGTVAFYNTHTNPLCRDSQLFECFQFIQTTRGQDVVVSCGDFNTKPAQLAYQLMTTCLGLQDAFQDEDTTVTCFRKNNIYTEKGKKPIRIDFIFFSNDSSPRERLALKDKKVSFSGLVPGKDFPYSDHEGVEATFVLSRLVDDEKPTVATPDRLYQENALKVLVATEQRFKSDRTRYELHTRNAVHTWILLASIVTLTALLLSNHFLFNLLSTYGLGWLCTLTPALLAACSVYFVFAQFSKRQICYGLEKNLADIRVMLRSTYKRNDSC